MLKPVRPPRPIDEPPPQAVLAMFARAGIDWAGESTDRPTRAVFCPRDDAWLPATFRRAVLDLAIRMGLDKAAQRHLAQQVANVNLSTGRAAQSTAAMTVLPGRRLPDLEFRPAFSLPRRHACKILDAYLAPLTRRDSYLAWLREMSVSQAFWRGAAADSPRVPETVWRREREHEAELLERWFDAPPARPAGPENASEQTRRDAERRYQLELRRYWYRQAQAEAFLRSEPAAPGLAVPPGASPAQERQLAALRRAASAQVYPLVIHKGLLAPANLFISEVAAPIAGYLDILEPTLRAPIPQAHLRASVLGVAYGLLALALIPTSCLFDRVHGTCVIDLLPRLADSRAVSAQFVRRELATVLLGQLHPEERADALPRLDPVVAAFADWADELGRAVERSYNRLLSGAVGESGGRIRTPQRFNPSGQWTITTIERQVSGPPRARRRRTPEMISHAENREADAEIYWLLRSLWAPLGTAAALINQSGMRFWFNAANNRWGGRHPPHDTHRLGNTVDFDIGFAWRSPDHRVPNVRRRDRFGNFLDDGDPEVRQEVDCLKGMNRVAGWIGVQAFLLAGVSSYLYADWGLIEEAGLHLSSLINIERPGTLYGHEEAREHANHWHFDMLVGSRPFEMTGEESPQAFPYEWQATDPDLFNRLWQLAAVRSSDPSFYERVAGLSRVPLGWEHLKELPDAEDWAGWFEWQRAKGTEGPGLSLLPVWNPQLARDTRAARSCAIPKLAPTPLFRPDAIPG